jgi:cysteine desulfurase
MSRKIYLDNNATTQIDRRVVQTLSRAMEQHYGNPSSIHWCGRDARHQLIHSRDFIAQFFGVKPQEILFTSSGTEGANMVLQGILRGALSTPTSPSRSHIISSDVEHPCVYSTLKKLEKNGHQVTFLPAGQWGAITLEAIQSVLQPNTRLITLMAVNNETGVKSDIPAIAAWAHQAGIPFCVDGVSWLGKEIFSLPLGISAIWFSGHKFHGPKGCGFTILRRSLKVDPLILGGEQEYGRRGGTEDLPGIMGLAHALELVKMELPAATERMERLRDKLESALIEQLSDVTVAGKGPRICNTLNMAFDKVDGETLLTYLDREGIAVSHGSACSSGALEPSRVLLNMGVPLALARSSLRFSLSRLTTEKEIDETIEILVQTVRRLRR